MSATAHDARAHARVRSALGAEFVRTYLNSICDNKSSLNCVFASLLSRSPSFLFSEFIIDLLSSKRDDIECADVWWAGRVRHSCSCTCQTENCVRRAKRSRERALPARIPPRSATRRCLCFLIVIIYSPL